MVDEIVQLEWDFFQQVHHIDGRASCQDDFETFYLQRKSQFEAFYQNVQKACLQDLKLAQQIGRNPIMEKYAYMMESTDPEYFDTIRDQLPAVDQQKKDFINALCDIEVSMREDMNDQYPYLLSQSRFTHSLEDEKDDTSFETYLRGELMTYSDETLYLYGQMVLDMVQKNENLIEKILMNTVKAYGYASLEDANKFIMDSEKK